MTEVVLVSMPFAALERPSLALSLLKAILEQGGISSEVRYPNLEVGERLGAHTYQVLGRTLVVDHVLDWVFTPVAFPDHEIPAEPFLRTLAGQFSELEIERMEPGRGRHGVWQKLRDLRATSKLLIDQLARRILEGRPRIVGCTSSFQQHVASLALLRRLRELDPEVVTLMGGANCETRMGLATHRNFHWVDYVVSGEADGLILPLCRAVLEHGRAVAPEELPVGVLAPCHRSSGYPVAAGAGDGVPRASFNNLDGLPSPDFSDYFRQLEASPLSSAITPGLLLETSRGCWWGAVSHCTFCGLNGGSMGFRLKSPERALEELSEVSERYGVQRIELTDNILSMSYFKSVIPDLIELGAPYDLFYETKANLTRERIQSLADAGISWIQPGIESFSTPILKMVNKGAEAWRNVLLLKSTRECDIFVIWAILWGFPGEQDIWYDEMASWIPLIEHLQAPRAPAQMGYNRYSPYHFRAEEYGLDLAPFSALESIYPMPQEDQADQAYFFVDRNESIVGHPAHQNRSRLRRPGVQRLTKAVEKWQRAFKPGKDIPFLSMEDRDGALHIRDGRSCRPREHSVLEHLDRAVYLASVDGPVSKTLRRKVAGSLEREVAAEEVEASLDRLRADKLLLTLDGHHLALALMEPVREWSRNRPCPAGEIDLEASLRLEEQRQRPAIEDVFILLSQLQQGS